MRDALLYVVASKPRDRQTVFGHSIGARAVALSDLTLADLVADPSLVIDLDLRSPDVVRRLKAVLPPVGGACRIFLVDLLSHPAAVQARALGANAVFPTTANARDIRTAIAAHFGMQHGDGTAGAAVRQSVKAGVEAMDGSFQALVDGAAFSMAGVDGASGQIADAIKGVGVDEWLATVRSYHVGTYQHCMLVTGVASAFGSGTGMARRDVIKLTVAGLLHDIGKAAIPIEILDKPGTLTDAETKIMRSHPVVGNSYLAEKSGLDADILGSVRSHHELLDGTGYPDGLNAGQIDDLTRILTICDIYAALIERRSYKPPKTPTQAMIVLDAMASVGKLEKSLVRELGRIMLARQAA